MSDNNIKKEYSNDEITITWESSKCIHAKACWKELKTVFKPLERPWINPKGDSSEKIIKQINKCPSGALDYYYNKNNKMSEEVKEEVMVKLKANKNGSLKVTGTVEIELPDGTTEVKSGRFSICRCGLSENKPFCDGAHKETNFDANWDIEKSE